LKDQVADMALTPEGKEKEMKKDKKTYSYDARMLVYDFIECCVPTENIPILLKKTAHRYGIELSAVPSRTTVEKMARELGILADYQSASILLASSDVTIAFDATSKEGRHYNTLIATTTSATLVLALDELAGGTAQDYADHAEETVNKLSASYAFIEGLNPKDVKKRLINKFSNVPPIMPLLFGLRKHGGKA
jgi:hypothetical protein